MKKKYRLKRKVKITGVIFITLICAAYLFAGGFNTLKSAYTSMINYLAAGDTPTIAKNIEDKHDGTYQLSLSVKGEAEKKPQKANVIVVFDTSSSMNSSTNQTETTYTPSNNNNALWGLVDGEYVQLTREWVSTGWMSGEWRYYYNGQRYTGQRYYQQQANLSRLEAAKAATNSLASSLLAHNGNGNPDDTIEIALVDFANTAVIAQSPTTDYDTFAATVNSRDAGNNDRGTNWEAGFRSSLNVDFNDSDPTYVIFVSDGNPTFYLQDPQNTQRGGSGQETTTNINTSYNQAVPAAQAVVNAGYNLYTIGIYGNVDRMEDITTDAGAPAGNYYSASDTAALQEAFGEILEKIEMSGIAEAVIDDGTTGEVKISSTDEHGLLRVDESSYKYTISFPINSDGKVQLNGKEATVSGNKITWGDGKELVGEVQGNNFIYTWTEKNDLYDFVPSATNTNGKVEWDLSECGVLVNEATYTVYFDVYPSQETYDMIAKIKNGKTTDERKALYDALDENVQKYLEPNTDYTSFSLKTNTTATLDYDDTRTPENEESITYKNPDPVATEATKIQVTKEWENDLDSQSSQPVSMDLKQNGKVIDHLTLNSDGNWTDSRFIATGLLKTIKDTNNNIIGLNVLDEGHDYTLTEPTDLDYYWELTAETVHPMKIDGELTTLIEVTGKDIPSGMGSSDYYADGSNKYYRINGKVYFAKYRGDTAQLTATNNRKSNLNVKKVVNGDALEGEKFKFTFNVNNVGDTDAWFSVWDTNKNEYVYDLDTNAKHGPDHPTADPTPGEESYYMENGNEFYVWLEDGWNLRFFNLGTGSTYSVEEVVNSPYDLKEVKAETIVTSTKELPATAVSIGNNQWRYGPEGDPDTIIFTKVEKDGKVYYSFSYTPKVEGKVTTGEVVAPNTSYNVQYTNEYPKTNFEIEKKWFDKTPTGTSVEMTLYKNGEPTEQKITLDGTKDDNGETAAWVATFKDLDLTENGEIIEYSAKETAINGYKAVYSGTATATVSADAPADESAIEAIVKADGEIVGTVELNKENDWIATTGAFEYFNADGSVKTVTVESATEGAEVSFILSDRKEVVTNYENTKVKVTKTWDDAGNQDGMRVNVDITLKADDEDLTSHTFTTEDSNSYTFENLDKYKFDDEGKLVVDNSGKPVEVVYTVEEKNVPTGYAATTSGDAATGFTVTNKHIPEVTDVTVIKVWDDAEDHDGFRPDELEVTLSNGDKVTLDKNNSWEATIPNLPKYANGQLITYTWTEGDLPEGYTLTNTSTTGYVTTLTNSYEPKYTEATVKKVWDDAEDQDGIRPEELEVTLSNGAKVTLKEGNNWTATIKDLPLYANGQEIKYSWTEGDLPKGYEMTGSSTQGTITTITNKHTPETIEVTAKKVWDDKDNQDGKRPTSVKFDLKVGNSVIDTIELDGIKDENGETAAWTATFKDLPKYEVGKVGVEIEYSVEEQTTDVLKGEDGPGTYDIITEGDYKTGYTITNKHTPELTEATVKKVWDDEGNQDGIRPDELEVTLSNGDKVTLKEGNNWTATIKDLPLYANGQEIKYSWTEGDLPEGYEMTDSSTKGTVTTITNKHTPETIEVTAKKVWDDKDNQDGKRPTSVKFDLKVGDDVIDTIDTIELDGTKDENGETAAWTATFTNLPKYEAGKVKVAIEYSVEEQTTNVLTGEDGPGTYDIITEGDQDKGYTITNKHTPELTEATVKKVWNDAEDQDGIRPEKLIVSLSNGTDHELNADNKWTVTVKNLDKYKDGQEITYSWTENQTGLPEGYELTNTTKKGTVTTLTNSYTPEVTSATIKKVWDDEKNQDGIRPDTLTVTLTANGKNPQTVVLNEGNQWEDTITGLPKKANGVDIKYEWTEGSLPEGYTMTDSSTQGTVTTITNKHTPETIEVTAKKVWDDKDNQDGKRPTSVKFDLKVGDDVIDTIDTIELDGTKDENGETAAWTATFTNLPKYEAGKVKVAIEYSVEEQTTDVLTGEDGPGTYDIITEGDQDKGYTITNKHTPELISSTVHKIWEDEDDRDGKRQETLNVTLTDGTNDIATKTLSESNDWTATVENLEKYSEGKEIKYTWREEDPINKYSWKSTNKDDETGIINITNHYDPEKTFVCIKKVWDDDNDREQLRPGTLRVTLNNGKFVDLNEANGWEAKIEGLYKYQNHGEEIKYTWVEENVDGYTLSGTSQDAELTTLTNTHDIETTEATVKKVWDDAGNQDGIRPDEITMVLSADDPTFEEQEVTLKESNEWKATISKLPKYMNTGKESPEEVTYTWTEKEVPTGYTLLDPEVDGTTTTLTNRHEPELIDIPVKKVWVNNTSINFPNPTEVRFKLLDNGNVVDTRTLKEANGWTDTFTDLPKYRPGSVREEIPYTVDEEDVTDYSKSIEGSITAGFTITNTYTPTLIPIKVTKIWDDADDQDGLRHPSIKMTLVGTVNGQTVYTSKTETVSGSNEETEWTFTFNGLPKYYLGQEITYKVEETLPDNSPYTGSSVTDLQIMNSYEPQTVTMTVYKDWADNEDNDRMRPETITVHLLKDGTEIDSRVMSDENGWSYTFGPLPKYRDHGTEIKYTVIEDPVDGYKADITYENGDKEYNAYVVNVHELEVRTLEVIKIWNDQNNKYNLRPNSITIEIYADGVKEITTTLTAEEGWKKKFLNMQKYKDGVEIVYTVKELPVANYTTSIDGLTITNTVIAPPEITPPNTYADGVATNENTNIFALIMMIITSLTISCFVRVNE